MLKNSIEDQIKYPLACSNKTKGILKKYFKLILIKKYVI